MAATDWPSRSRQLQKAQQELEDLQLVLKARNGSTRGARHADPALHAVRPAEGKRLLPRRRWQRRPDPGGADRPLQGGARLSARQGDVVPLLRRALRDPPDHHGDQERDALQALAPQQLRLVQPHACGSGPRRRLHARGRPAGIGRQRPGGLRHLDRGAAEPRRLPRGRRCRSSSRTRSVSTSRAARTSRWPRSSGATRRRSTTRSSGSSARSSTTSASGRCCCRSSLLESCPRGFTAGPHRYHRKHAGVAQLAEHRFCKPGVAGSSPASGSAARASARGGREQMSVSVRTPVFAAALCSRARTGSRGREVKGRVGRMLVMVLPLC